MRIVERGIGDWQRTGEHGSYILLGITANLREVSGRFFVLCLFFCEESREGNDICVDGLIPNCSAFAIAISCSV